MSEIERPDHIKCIKNLEELTWCGRPYSSMGWLFQSIDHAALNGDQEGRLVACPECTKAVIKALSNGQES